MNSAGRLLLRIAAPVGMMLLLAVPALAADINNYCITPSFLAPDMKPNLLLMIDNSASMYDLGYIAGSTSAAPTYSCGTATVTSSDCFDNSYSNTQDYEGYFSRIDSASNSIIYPVYQYSGGKFVEIAGGVPTTTDVNNIYGTSYFHITMTGSKTATPASRAVTSFIASGRFLNWLSASKFDIQKKILTGGKYDTAGQMLIGESRGCVGRRFVKVVPAVPGISFAVRGPTAVEPNYDSSTQGGGTRIEIFEGTYNQSDCQCAVYNWTSGNYGQASTDTGDCLGVTPSDKALATLNHTQQTCWKLKENILDGATTDAAVWQGINTTDIETACTKVYADIPASALTNESSGNYICTSAATHASPVAPYNLGGSDTTGFVGSCWRGSGSSEKFTGAAAELCVKREILHYCQGVNFAEVTDPSSTLPASGNIPAVIMDAGVRAIGSPVGPSGGAGTCSTQTATSCSTDSGCNKLCSNDSALTCSGSSDCVSPGVCLAQTCNNPFYGKVGVSSAPTGLIDDFAGKIRFGAMRFNEYGSATECGSSTIACPKFCSVRTSKMCSTNTDCVSGEGTCQAVTNKDAGMIMVNSYIGDPIGNHSSGLINDIDSIMAKTWTPFAEAYYNAIAYFVKDAIATTPSLNATEFTPSATSPLPIAAPLAGTDSYTNKNPILFRCQQNNILLITDGSSTADANSVMTNKVTDASNVFRDPATTAETGSTSGACGSYSGSPYLHDLSYFAYHRNIFKPSEVCRPAGSSDYDCDEAAQTIKTHVVYNAPVTSDPTNVCAPYTQMNKTAINGGTVLKSPANPMALRNDLRDTLQSIAGGSASGTAASILSNSEGSGANILQAVFYPKKYFGTTPVTWLGELQNLWYYIDPFIGNSTVRDDNFGAVDPDLPNTHFLKLKSNYALKFFFDQDPSSTSFNQTMVERRRDLDGNGTGDAPVIDTISPDAVKSIWRAGKNLWSTAHSARTIYTPCLESGSCITGTSVTADTTKGLMSFTNTLNATALQPLLQVADEAEATKLAEYTAGLDKADYRSRTVSIDGSSGVWKLGDIISSTPRLQSSVKVNGYDVSAPAGYGDASYAAFVKQAAYGNRGMVYVGANDGMLHAFKLGKLEVTPRGDQKASITGTNLGNEQWAFIPKNSLPYLRYLSCKAGNGDALCANQDYNHLFFVDGSTTVADVSIGGCESGTYDACVKNTATGSNWRTVLLAGMGLGGASKNATDACVEGAEGTCVKTPLAGTGYSSYFALDITNQNYNAAGALVGPPKLMWEFAVDGMGFATTGAATVRIGADKNKNGKWFAVFGSGPTGPIDVNSHQFLGKSTQNLKIFVVDMNATPPFVAGSNYWVIDGGSALANAFVSSVTNSTIDADRWNSRAAGNYQDDALYFGYVQASSATIVPTTKWQNGGVLRLVTKQDPNPANWEISKVVDGIGPVTTSIARLQDRKNHNLWLYFGDGRYYFSGDDLTTSRRLYGLKEPCYTATDTLNPACTTTKTDSDLSDQTDLESASATISNSGWRIDLDPQDTAASLGAERVITDPVALTNGAVFFTTFMPTSDACKFGGNSYLWATRYDTGLQAPDAALEGKALVQVSTGSFEEIDLASAFTDKGNRRTGYALTGKPPSDPPPIVSKSNLKPVKRIMQIQEH